MKHRNSSLRTALLPCLLSCLLCVPWLNALADLSVSGTPGFTFSDTPAGRPTVANLNRALRFTYAVSGTVGGTNANIAANSVNGDKLTTSVAGSNLVFYGSPRSLAVADDGIGTNQLAEEVAGLGLGSDSGLLRVNVDTNTVQITNDVVTLNLTTFSNLVLTLATNVAQYTFTNLSLSYVTPELTLAVGGLTNVAHNLGAKPTNLRGVLICKTNDNEYVVGDEIDLRTCWNNQPVFCFGANTTNVFISLAASGFQVADKLSGSTVAVTLARWRAKLYAAP